MTTPTIYIHISHRWVSGWLSVIIAIIAIITACDGYKVSQGLGETRSYCGGAFSLTYRRVLFDRLGHGRQHFNNTGTLNKTGSPLFRDLVVSCTEKPNRHWRWETCCAKTWLYSCSCYDDILPVIVLGILVSSSLFCIRLLICSYVGSLQYWQVIPFVDPGVWANFS